MKYTHDRSIASLPLYEIGNLVLLETHNHPRSSKILRKMKVLKRGPYRIHAIDGHHCVLKYVDGNILKYLFPLRKLQHIEKYTDTFLVDKESVCLLDDVTPESRTDFYCNARLDIDKLFCSVPPEFETTLSIEDHVSGPFTDTDIRGTDPVRDLDAVMSVNSETSVSDSWQLLGSAHVLDTLSYSAPHDNNDSTKDVALTALENEQKHGIIFDIPLHVVVDN